MTVKAPFRRSTTRIEADEAKLAEYVDKLQDVLAANQVNSQKHHSGLRVVLPTWPNSPDSTVYIYVMPWSRGWSVFVDDKLHTRAQDWRDVTSKYAGLQRAIYSPRGSVGPWSVQTLELVIPALSYLDVLRRQEIAKLAAHAKKHWYWPRACLRRDLE